MKKTKQYIILLLSLFICSFQAAYANDFLRVIELSSSGQSESVEIPGGHIFTYGIFVSDSETAKYDDAYGIIEYSEPVELEIEAKRTANENNQHYGWYLGPAKISLKSSLESGARMQLYVRKLPDNVVSGVLSEQNPSHTVNIPEGHLITSLLDFEFNYESQTTGMFKSYLNWYSDSSISYGVSKITTSYGASPYLTNVESLLPNPRVSGGVSRLQDEAASASDVINGYFYDNLDYVTPTADFCGPGKAIFSLPPAELRKTDLAFYCYKITPANIIFGTGDLNPSPTPDPTDPTDPTPEPSPIQPISDGGGGGGASPSGGGSSQVQKSKKGKGKPSAKKSSGSKKSFAKKSSGSGKKKSSSAKASKGNKKTSAKKSKASKKSKKTKKGKKKSNK